MPDLLALHRWKWLTALLYPQYCPSCSDELSDGSGWICDTCWIVQPTRQKAVFKAYPLLNEKVTVPFAYAGEFKRLIHMMKFYGRRDIAAELGRRSAERYVEWNQSLLFDAIVPVPLHPVRVRERGYDQNLQIAESIAETMHIPCRTDLIVRTRNTPAQARLSDEERLTNLRGAFQSIAQNGENIPKSVLLVDDVIHTGSTVAGSVKALKSAGVKYTRVLACCG